MYHIPRHLTLSRHQMGPTPNPAMVTAGVILDSWLPVPDIESLKRLYGPLPHAPQIHHDTSRCYSLMMPFRLHSLSCLVLRCTDQPAPAIPDLHSSCLVFFDLKQPTSAMRHSSGLYMLPTYGLPASLSLVEETA
jgi:hypothetical protein